MKTRIHGLRRGVALTALALAVAAPSAIAAPVEQLLPSGNDGGQNTSATYSSVNSIVPPEAGEPTGSPGATYASVNSIVPPEPTSSPVTASGPSDGFDWGDAGLGATAMLAILAMAVGAAFALRHRPRRAGSIA